MNLNEIKMFCAVVQTGSVTGAAALLHRVPSNITTRIKNLEAALGEPLFIRSRKRLYLSEAGERFLPYARKMLLIGEEARNAISSPSFEGALSIGAMESTAATRLPSVLGAFHRLWPQVRLSLKTGATRDLIELLRKKEMDVAFVDLSKVELKRSYLDLQSYPAFDEELMIVTPRDIEYVSQPSDVHGLSVLVFGSGCSYRHKLLDWYDEYGESIPPIIEMNSYHGILACVSAGIGLSLLPRSVLALSRPEEISCSSFQNGHCKTYMVWRAEKDTTLIKQLQQLLPGMLHVNFDHPAAKDFA